MSLKPRRTKNKGIKREDIPVPDFPNKKAYVSRVLKDGTAIYGDKYTEEQRLFIVTCIAHMMSTQEIRDAFKEQFGIEFENASNLIGNYKRTAKWKSIIDKTRVKYLADMEDVPGFHKKVRLRRHERVYEGALKKGDYKNAISATEHQRKEIEGDSSTLNLSLYNNKFNIFTDEELSQKHLEALEKVKRLSEKKGALNESTTQTITIGT